MCLYDQTFYLKETSAWCSAFTPGQIFDLEYPEDLRKYYKSGYGRKSNDRLLCGVMKDMINHIESDEQPNIVAYFTHSSSILPLLNSLNASKDLEPLRADNYNRMPEKKWRLSEIAPAAGNIAVIKYKCRESDKVKFFLNEQPIDLEGCDRGLCNLKHIKERYKAYIQADSSTFFCNNSTETL